MAALTKLKLISWCMGFFMLACTSTLAAALPGKAWLLADQPTSNSYTPHFQYSYNSSGSINQVSRLDAGYYQVLFKKIGRLSGIVHVASYGGSLLQDKWLDYPGRCSQSVYKMF